MALFSKAVEQLNAIRLSGMRKKYSLTPAPLDFVRRLQNKCFYITDFQSSLFPPRSILFQSEYFIQDKEISQLLRGQRLGLWAMSAESLNYIINWLLSHAPDRVIECGSGVSTLCIAAILRRMTTSHYAPHLISFEQSVEQVGITEALLESQSLSDYVTVAHAPLTATCSTYGSAVYSELKATALELLNGEKCDLLVVDGPYGESACRYHVVPELLPSIKPGGTIFMDDALRDGELLVAKKWEKISGIAVEGVVFAGKGLLVANKT